MIKLYRDIEALGGLASYRELQSKGHERWAVEIPVMYRKLIRVRVGWYADVNENIDVVRAWRVGGRLTCVSALAWREGAPMPATLHVEVPANASRLHSPLDYRLSLGEEHDVIIHWARRPAPGDRRAVGVRGAWAAIARCEQGARETWPAER